VALPPALLEMLQGRFIGLLVVGEPGSGKTTLLREIARSLAGQNRAVAVVDEREELFPAQESGAAVALDCIAGLPKRKAVQMALRTLGPQVILLDELGGLDEAAALEQGFFSGVDFVASLHAANWEEALRRPQVRYLQTHGMVRAVALLEGRAAPGRIREVRWL
jgi:stage III sporulation protein AA